MFQFISWLLPSPKLDRANNSRQIVGLSEMGMLNRGACFDTTTNYTLKSTEESHLDLLSTKIQLDKTRARTMAIHPNVIRVKITH